MPLTGESISTKEPSKCSPVVSFFSTRVLPCIAQKLKKKCRIKKRSLKPENSYLACRGFLSCRFYFLFMTNNKIQIILIIKILVASSSSVAERVSDQLDGFRLLSSLGPGSLVGNRAKKIKLASEASRAGSNLEPRVSPAPCQRLVAGDQPLTKSWRNSGLEIERVVKRGSSTHSARFARRIYFSLLPTKEPGPRLLLSKSRVCSKLTSIWLKPRVWYRVSSKSSVPSFEYRVLTKSSATSCGSHRVLPRLEYRVLSTESSAPSFGSNRVLPRLGHRVLTKSFIECICYRVDNYRVLFRLLPRNGERSGTAIYSFYSRNSYLQCLQ